MNAEDQKPLPSGRGAITWLRYVLHADVPAFEAKGWKIHTAPMLGPHGTYSCLMQWGGTDEPA